MVGGGAALVYLRPRGRVTWSHRNARPPFKRGGPAPQWRPPGRGRGGRGGGWATDMRTECAANLTTVAGCLLPGKQVCGLAVPLSCCKDAVAGPVLPGQTTRWE